MEFPDTVEGFGYEFSEDGKLQDIETGKSFEFNVKEDDHSYNQKRYEALGELITPHIYNLLEKRCGLKRHPVPIDVTEKESSTFIFCSENFSESEKLLILIHGSGVVRAGQWARRLIINDSLDSGTQIPFIERGLKEDYGVLVMNTNDNYRENFGKRIRGSESAESHGKYVWENYVRNCKAKKIAIVAHSYGGVVATSLYKKYQKEFQEKVFAIAMTDSFHFINSDIRHLIQIGRNWVTSQLPLDSPVHRRSKDIPCVSAGCMQHEMTSWSSFDSIFRFFNEKLLHPDAKPKKNKRKLSCTFFEDTISSDEEITELEVEPDLKGEPDLKIDSETTIEVEEGTRGRESSHIEGDKGEELERGNEYKKSSVEETTDKNGFLSTNENKNGSVEKTTGEGDLLTDEEHKNGIIEKSDENFEGEKLGKYNHENRNVEKAFDEDVLSKELKNKNKIVEKTSTETVEPSTFKVEMMEEDNEITLPNTSHIGRDKGEELERGNEYKKSSVEETTDKNGFLCTNENKNGSVEKTTGEETVEPSTFRVEMMEEDNETTLPNTSHIGSDKGEELERGNEYKKSSVEETTDKNGFLCTNENKNGSVEKTTGEETVEPSTFRVEMMEEENETTLPNTSDSLDIAEDSTSHKLHNTEPSAPEIENLESAQKN